MTPGRSWPSTSRYRRRSRRPKARWSLDKADGQDATRAADVTQLEATWSDWITQADENPEVARQLLRKVLAAPIAVRPVAKDEWRFAGFSRFDAVLAGGVAKGSGFAEIRDY
jgi:hypothetical protein